MSPPFGLPEPEGAWLIFIIVLFSILSAMGAIVLVTWLIPPIKRFLGWLGTLRGRTPRTVVNIALQGTPAARTDSGTASGTANPTQAVPAAGGNAPVPAGGPVTSGGDGGGTLMSGSGNAVPAHATPASGANSGNAPGPASSTANPAQAMLAFGGDGAATATMRSSTMPTSGGSGGGVAGH